MSSVGRAVIPKKNGNDRRFGIKLVHLRFTKDLNLSARDAKLFNPTKEAALDLTAPRDTSDQNYLVFGRACHSFSHPAASSFRAINLRKVSVSTGTHDPSNNLASVQNNHRVALLCNTLFAEFFKAA